ncbi:MAG: cadherin domain-containing protein [Cyclobacteriaceae bacterium]
MRIYLTVVILLFSGMLYAQVAGSILDPAVPAINPMNPNGDGFSTSTNSAFIGPLDETQFELPFVPFQQYQSEPGIDNQYAAGCELYELVHDAAAGAESAYFYYKDPDSIPDNGDELMFFRFRLAKWSNGSTAFSVLVDTDYLFGISGPEADPNGLPGNPGFEKEIAVYNSTGVAGGVRVFNVDGMATATVVNYYASNTSHYQVSYALNQDPACTDRPVFVDMYVPFSALGILSTTQVRMAVAVNEDIGSSLGGGASDIGGVNGNALPNDDDQFMAAITNHAPIAIGNLINKAPVPVNTAVSLDENASNGSTVHVVSASDPNSDVLTYSITAGNTGSAFIINAGTGEITVNNSSALDAETTLSFPLVVRVTDGLLYDNAIITVNLVDVNESSPSISDASISLDENTINGSVIHSMAGTDPDVTATLSYSIIAGSTGTAFAINSSSGRITVNDATLINFEVTPTFYLIVRVDDGLFFDDATIQIKLSDVNESPSIEQALISLDENSPNGFLVHTVEGSDPDTGAQLNYTIVSGNTGAAFTIDDISGEIKVRNSSTLDFETTSVFTLNVRVSDGALFSEAIIEIRLRNVNEPPSIQDGSVTLERWLRNGEVIYTVIAQDPDANDALSFAIESGNDDGLFSVDNATGEIKILDVEPLKLVTRSFDFGILATDQGGLTALGRIQVTIVRISGRSDIRPLKGFSPDGNGVNDFWLIQGIEGFPENSIQVFNRWGVTVYETNGYNNERIAWRGEVMGSVIEFESTYFYIIKAGDFEPITGYIIVKP